jgi:hypothetical protein
MPTAFPAAPTMSAIATYMPNVCQHQRVAYKNAFATKMRVRIDHWLVGRQYVCLVSPSLRTHREVSGAAANIERSRTGC